MCEQRDVKGLYEKARAGIIKGTLPVSTLGDWQVSAFSKNLAIDRTSISTLAVSV